MRERSTWLSTRLHTALMRTALVLVAGATMALCEPLAAPTPALADDVAETAAVAMGGPSAIERAVSVRGWGLTEALQPLPRLARAPRGYVEFCAKNPSDCRPSRRQGMPSARAATVTLTPQLLTELDAINREVNDAVHPITDQRLYARLEHWTYPRRARLRLDTGGEIFEALAGDCEDYVLLKRAKLRAAGWPDDALLITVVRDLEGLGHAVLTVRTDKGDLILDNQAETIAHWKATGYAFIKRQSARDTRLWVSLGTPVLEATSVGNTD